MHKILYNFATRSRPDNFFRGLENITSLATHPNYQIIVTADLDDTSMCNPSVRDRANQYPNTKIYYGNSLNKIDAINKNLGLMGDDVTIIVNMSDDMIFLVQGFDQVIIKAMDDNFPDTDGFLHFMDGNQPRLATMSIVGRQWFNRTNYIYNPEYISLFADNEEFDKAIMLKKYKYMGDDVRILHHMHPIFVKSVKGDSQYDYTESFYGVDRLTYLRRKKDNFWIKR